MLPPEIVQHALLFLGPYDRLTARCVCRLFLDLVDSDAGWRDLYVQEWSATPAQISLYQAELQAKVKRQDKRKRKRSASDQAALQFSTSSPLSSLEAATASMASTTTAGPPPSEHLRKRKLPYARGLKSWKQLFWLRRKIERQHFEHGPPPADSIELDPHQRTVAMYLRGGGVLYDKRPTVEDDPMQWSGEQDKFDTRLLYVIALEQYVSSLSFPLSKEERRDAYVGISNVAIEFAIYQKQYPHTASGLRSWYQRAIKYCRKAYELAPPDLKPLEQTSLAGVIRTYADADIHTREETINLLKSVIDLFPQRDERTPQQSEECAYAMHDIASHLFDQQENSHDNSEAREWFDAAIDEYVLAADDEDASPLVFFNMADAIKEKAALVDAIDDKLALLDRVEVILDEAKDLVDPMDEDMVIQMVHCAAVTFVVRARFLQDRIHALRRELAEGAEALDVQATRARLAMDEAALQKAVAQTERELTSSAAALSDPYTDFCFARIYAVAERFDECRQWLEKCREKRYLGKMKRFHRISFDSVAELDWFRRMVLEQTTPSLCRPDGSDNDE